MDKQQTFQQDWYVIFTGSPLKHWLMRWLDPKFKHCYMVREDDGIWLIVNSCEAATVVTSELVDDYPHIRLLCKDSVILPVTINVREGVFQWHLGINSCVDVCKGLLGLRAFWIWTPFQLYTRLHNGRSIRR